MHSMFAERKQLYITGILFTLITSQQLYVRLYSGKRFSKLEMVFIRST